MKTKTTLLFVLTTLLLGIVGTPALLASSDSKHRGGYGDNSYRIHELAQEVEYATERLYYDAKKYNHHGRHGRSYLGALDDLHDCAEDYRRAVSKNRGLDRSYDDFRGLFEAYREADYALKNSGNRYAREELYRVGRLLQAIDGEYSRAHRTSRYDNRRYDDRRYDDRRGRDRGRYDDDWRRRRGPRGTIVLPRIRIELPF